MTQELNLNKMEIKAKCHEVGATVQATESLKKRELIVEYIENPQYPEYLKFECINDKCAMLDSLRPGDDIEVFFNLKGRPWTDKTGKKSYFNSLQLWKVSVLGKVQAHPTTTTSSKPDEDDLPF